MGPSHLTFWNVGDINSFQQRSQPITQQRHSEQCPVQHKYLINIYQSLFSRLFFFIIAITFFVKLYNPVCSLLNGVNHTLAVYETHPASLFKREKKKPYVHVTPTTTPEFHVGGSGVRQRAGILETSPHDSNKKPRCGPTSGAEQFPVCSTLTLCAMQTSKMDHRAWQTTLINLDIINSITLFYSAVLIQDITLQPSWPQSQDISARRW